MSALYDKKKCPLCGGTVILKRKGVPLRSAGFYQGPDTTASWECIVCRTEFDADFNYNSTGSVEARNREVYVERHTEGVPIAGEVYANNLSEQIRSNFPRCTLQSSRAGASFYHCSSPLEDCFKCPLNANKK